MSLGPSSGNPLFRISLLAFLLQGLLPSAGWGKTTRIHVTGIDPKHAEQNYASFYEEAAGFVQACKNSGLKNRKDCRLYIDLTLAGDKAKSLVKFADAYAIPSPKVALDDLETTLNTAAPGDQIVFSLSNHGGNGLVKSSCIFTGPSSIDAICMSDVKKVLERSKPPGVKVFVVADACMSGAFSELSTKEVCTAVASDRFRTAGGLDLWQAVVTKQKKNNRKPFTITDLKPVVALRYHYEELGGGFGSDVVRSRACNNQKHSASLEERNEMAKEFWRKREKLKSLDESLQMRKAEVCETKGASRQYVDLFNFAGMGSVFEGNFNWEQGKAGEFFEKYCKKPAPDTQNLCSALLQLKGVSFREALKEVKEVSGSLDQVYNKAATLDTSLRERIASNPNHPKVAEWEAQRGALYKKLKRDIDIAQKKIFAAFEKGYLDQIFEALSKIEKELCFDMRKETGKWEWERLMYRLSLSALRPDRVPNTQKALQEAIECENSFVFE